MAPDILADFEGNPGAAPGDIEALLQSLGHPLPTDYLTFMREFNGGEGFIGKHYVVLWKVQEIIRFNDEYEVREYAPGLLFFGSSGGGEGFAFNLLESGEPVVQVPFIGMDLEGAILLSPTFCGFLEAAAAGEL